MCHHTFLQGLIRAYLLKYLEFSWVNYTPVFDWDLTQVLFFLSDLIWSTCMMLVPLLRLTKPLLSSGTDQVDRVWVM